ncbi:MAG: efflux RND transporter periplasmic adaptor subunit [Gammaproteobacteria bacterium]|jgi:membrane fusion protein (multidrug efflux system)
MKKFILIIVSLCLCITLNAYAKEQQLKLPPPIVSVGKVIKKKWQSSIMETGSLSAFNGIMVKAETSGRVTDIFFKSGQFVKKGDKLVQIYPDILEAELQRTEANLELNQMDYKRYSVLTSKQFYPQSDLDKIRTKVKEDQATIKQLKAELVQTLIRAHFDGKIGLRQISIGDYLSPGDSIAYLESLDPIRVEFSVPETYLQYLKLNQKISMATRAYPNQTFTGKIFAFNSTLDTNTRTLDVWASVPNSQYQLTPGTFVEVTVYFGELQDVLMVPQTAIVYGENENFVYRVVNHKAVKTTVIQGEKLNDNMVVIMSGLKEGEEVVTGGQIKLKDGSPLLSEEEAQQMFSQQQANQNNNKKSSSKAAAQKSNSNTAPQGNTAK